METNDRVAAAERLFAALDEAGRVELGVLTDEDECVLGAGRWVMSDAAVWRAWMSCSDGDRAATTRAVVDSLVERGFVTDVDDEAESFRLELSATAGLVAAVRSRPAFVVTALTAPELLAPLAYGVVDEVAGLRGVVVELRDSGVHDYRLLSVGRAAEGLATWAHDAVTTSRWGARCDTVVLEVLRHREGESLQAAAVTVEAPQSPRDGIALSFGGRRTRYDAEDPAALRAAVEQLLREAAATVRANG